jgi:hypothetical protein
VVGAGRKKGRLFDASTQTQGVRLSARVRLALVPALIIALFGALVVWIFWRELFDGWTFPSDFLGGSSTTPAFVAATIGRGHPLAWSPFVASGFPVDVDPQAGVYFPVWWLLGALRVPLTLGVITDVQVAHVLLGGIGVMLLARARRLTWRWAMVAGVAYLFFGGFYGQSEHAGYFRGFAYLPWLLWTLTPPASGRWTRLLALPLLAWLIATGAYPALTVSFGLAGLVYVATALRVDAPGAWRRHRSALTLAIIASGAVCAAVLLPYLRAEHAGELVRLSKPTAAVRATYAIGPLDLLGLYLNNCAWAAEGTLTSWAIGTPILVGLACARPKTFTAQVPLAACGALALALAMGPKVGFVGRAMASLGVLFDSRFPASDYKSVVALALILMSVDAWSRVGNGARPVVAVMVAAGVLAGGILLAPHTYAQPTTEPWLALGVIAASGALAFVRPAPWLFACALTVLVVIDGARDINDYGLAGTTLPWQVAPAYAALFREGDGDVSELPARLMSAPSSRPARVPGAATAQRNSAGWLADGYHVNDYNPTLERALWQAERNPDWERLLLEPWHAFVFPCAAVGCSTGNVRLPPPSGWRVSPDVHTTSYGAEKIVYSVNLSRPMLMVENELAIAGWRSSTGKVTSVNSGIPLRTWRLAPGTYEFTASFHEPGRTPQELTLTLVLVAWLCCILVVGPGARRAAARGKRRGRCGRTHARTPERDSPLGSDG